MRNPVVAALGAVVLACASSSVSSERDAGIVVTGTVITSGPPPYVRLVVVTEGDPYELVGDRAEGLWRLQQRRVTIRGHVVRAADPPDVPAQLEVHSYTVLRAEWT